MVPELLIVAFLLVMTDTDFVPQQMDTGEQLISANCSQDLPAYQTHKISHLSAVATKRPISKKNIKIESAYMRATMGSMRNSAAYMSISSTIPDRLIQVTTPEARAAELHTVLENDQNIMRMRRVKAIEIVPGNIMRLKPGGYHIMIIDLFAPLKKGTTIPLTLVFEKAGEIKLQIPIVQPSGSMSH